ncbi:MAG: hypothetical protein HN849_32665 [Victivallales bacterium]|jgi:hypothetical protein|nr:hypothetical protein [Victivallales bacterium]
MTQRMNSRERILAAVRRDAVDYVPCCGFFNPLSSVQRQGHTWNFPWASDAPLPEQLRYQVEELGLDQLVNVGVAAAQAAAGITSRKWQEGDVLHKAYETPAGTLHASVRINDLWPHGQEIPFYSDFNIGHYVEPWIQTAEDLACFQCLQVLRDRDEVVDEARAGLKPSFALAQQYGLATQAVAGMGLTGAQHLFGAADLCLMTIDNPELVDAYLEHEHQMNLARIAALGELGVDIVRRNGFYETADFYGPDMLRRFLTRRLTAETAMAHQGGMAMAYTVHTGVMPILDYLSELPLDSLQGIDIAFGGVDLPKVRDTLAADKAFWIGPSSTYHIWEGPEATRQAVREVFDCFGKTGLILSQCVSSHSIMPWESTLAMVDEWRRLR